VPGGTDGPAGAKNPGGICPLLPEPMHFAVYCSANARPCGRKVEGHNHKARVH